MISPEELSALSIEFDEMCQARHAMGAEKYGPVNFMKVDSIEMALEELADLANYTRYTFIKLRLLQNGIQEQLQPTQMGPEGIIKP